MKFDLSFFLAVVAVFLGLLGVIVEILKKRVEKFSAEERSKFAERKLRETGDIVHYYDQDKSNQF